MSALVRLECAPRYHSYAVARLESVLGDRVRHDFLELSANFRLQYD